MMSRSLIALSAAALLLAGGAARANKQCPNIMLVLDQSGSMDQDPNGNEPMDPAFQGPSKWELLQQVITEVIKEYGDHVPFGMELFSTQNIHVSDDICFNQTSIIVPLIHNSGGDIIKQLKAAKPLDGTNTNGAIRRARLDMALMDPNPKKSNIIILVTDGNPNCGTDLTAADPQTMHIDGTQMGTTVDEIIQASKQKPQVFTYVIGFDGDMKGVNAQNLDDMAYYGLGPGNHPCGHMGEPHCYYKAGVTFQDFKDTLDKIVREAGGGETGLGSICDDSCYTQGCPAGQVCTTQEVNLTPHCVPNPCQGAQCGGDTYCRQVSCKSKADCGPGSTCSFDNGAKVGTCGQCVKACTKGCPPAQRCQDGACVPDLCAGNACKSGQVCDPSSGGCVDFPCPICTTGAICDIPTGKCVADQCKDNLVVCPSSAPMCIYNGNCTNVFGGGGGGGGCSASGASPTPRTGRFDAGTLVAGTALLLSLAMLIRRRRRNPA